MKIVVLDDSRTRAGQIAELLRKRKHDVVCCTASNEFMAATQESAPKMLFLDVEAWKKCKSIYNYFDWARKLADIPIVFYNAPDEFPGLQDRQRLEKDVVLNDQATVENIAESLTA
jgi:DNA-binding response OmpR family regulator